MRNQCSIQARARRFVWILIGSDSNSFALRPLNHRDCARALAPDLRAQSLDMRDVHCNVRFTTDANCLFDGTEQSDGVRALVAHVAVVVATLLGCRLR